MTTFRRKAMRLGLAMLLGVCIVLPVALAWHTVDVRNARRDLNQTKLSALDEITKLNSRRAHDNRETLRHICNVQNTDAHSLNRVIDYFERVAKAQYPGPVTDKFWREVPRPPVHPCTSTTSTTTTTTKPKGTP